MSWLLAFLGFAFLIILHEAGHFFAAKAVGMRVERFALFFPPLVAKRKRGETEYAIGSIPLGGYVKITGMNPAEDIPPEHAHRAYYRQPVWKRIFVIGAGPAVNIALAFAIMAGVFMARGPIEPPLVVGNVEANLPADGKLQEGDKVIAVDGRRLTGNYSDQLKQVTETVGQHKGDAVSFTVDRNGQTVTITGNTFLDNQQTPPRYRFGFGYDQDAMRTDLRAGRVLGPGAGRDVVRHVHHGQPHRADLRLRETQGDRQRRRRLRDDAGGDLDRLGDRAVRARADLAQPRRHQPVPVPAARRRPHLLGARREGARQGDPVRRHGTGRLRRASRWC